MNVFEDLIDELKNENLLEDTVIELKKGGAGEMNVAGTTYQSPNKGAGKYEVIEASESRQAVEDTDLLQISAPKNDREFYRKRAMEEVSSLQMVEHVLGGVEREHFKTPAATFDDLNVKKALHKFMTVAGDVHSEAHAAAEYALLQETQGWHTALSARDKVVSVANVRRFCENSRPVLSSQALMALARFYRNSSFTEDVRGKFEYVMTRLFSKELEREQRKLLFSRTEMIGHIRTLYGNWSSLTYHSIRDNQSEIDLAIQRVDDIARHFESAETLDDLLNADIFNTIRHFKEECGELFFVPEVTAAAIDCNVRLGNKYVDLIFKEQSRYSRSALEAKYGCTYDQAASDAAGKTLLLVDLLKQQHDDGIEAPPKKPEFEQEISAPVAPVVIRDSGPAKRGIFGVSRWLVVVTVIAVAVSVGLFFGADKFALSDESIRVASEMDLQGTEFKTHIRTMRISHETAYAMTEPSWDAMSEHDRRELLKKIYAFAAVKGLKTVNVLNYKGRTVAYASGDRFEIVDSN